jgi:hypothetical protein
LYVPVKKILLVTLSTILVAACGTAASSERTTIAGATVSRISVQAPVANDESQLDLKKANPPIRKGIGPVPIRPVPLQAQPSAAATPAAQDRCSVGWPGPGGAQTRASGKHLPMPACAVQ